MVTFKLTTPASVGFPTSVTLSEFSLTEVSFSTTPPIAPLGAAQLNITLTETTNKTPLSIKYLDTSVVAFFAQVAPTPASGETVEDVMSQLIFTKLVADGKLPPGTITTS